MSELELLHYGVKGMQWGVRKRDPAVGVARKEVRKDLKTTERLANTSTRGVVAKRQTHAESVGAKKSSDPNYAKAYDRAIQNKQRAATGKALIKTAAWLAFTYVALFGTGSSSSGRSSATRGRNFINDNPGMMNAPIRNGVHVITNL